MKFFWRMRRHKTPSLCQFEEIFIFFAENDNLLKMIMTQAWA
jgi:hypothetical protein